MQIQSIFYILVLANNTNRPSPFGHINHNFQREHLLPLKGIQSLHNMSRGPLSEPAGLCRRLELATSRNCQPQKIIATPCDRAFPKR